MKYFAHAIFLFYSNNTGDHYLGRLLAGLDPHQTTFGDLPPHFKVGMENEYIHDFMYLLYGPIIRQYKEKLKIIWCLIHFAVSLVYHSGTFEDIILQKPYYFFFKAIYLFFSHVNFWYFATITFLIEIQLEIRNSTNKYENKLYFV